MINSTSDYFDFTGREVTLEVRHIVLSVPEAELYETEEIEMAF